MSERRVFYRAVTGEQVDLWGWERWSAELEALGLRAAEVASQARGYAGVAGACEDRVGLELWVEVVSLADGVGRLSEGVRLALGLELEGVERDALEIRGPVGCLTLGWDPESREEVSEARAAVARLKAGGYAVSGVVAPGNGDEVERGCGKLILERIEDPTGGTVAPPDGG